MNSSVRNGARFRLNRKRFHLTAYPALRFTEPLEAGGSCDRKTQLMRMAAFAGYRSICLGYDNTDSVNDRCSGQPAGCERLVRQEVVYGTDDSPQVSVDAPNSVLGRLVSLLEYLAQQQPAGDWDRYLNAGNVRWDQLVLSGWSQGAGHVGVLARDHALARAIYLSKAVGTELTATCVPTPSDMLWDERATPPEDQYLFIHTDEGAYAYSPEVMEVWGIDAFGWFVDVNSEAAPYGCTHLLATSAAPAVRGDFHKSMASDLSMPMDGDVPLNAPAYLYMLTAP